VGGVVEAFFEDVSKGFFGREIEVVARALDFFEEEGGAFGGGEGDEAAGDEDAKGLEGRTEQAVCEPFGPLFPIK
jgi:hypothetical protein